MAPTTRDDSRDEARSPREARPQKQDVPASETPRLAVRPQSTSFEGMVFPFSRSPEEDEIREMYGWGV